MMSTLWLILTLIIWGVGAAYPGYNSKPFLTEYRGDTEPDWETIIPYSIVVFIVGLFSVPIVGLALIGAAVAVPVYGMIKLGQKIRRWRELRGKTDA